jgi:hypothetical protein
VKRLAGKPFAMLGVNSDPDREGVKKTLAEENLNWPNWWDDGRLDGPIHTIWQVSERPAIHVLDAKGVIRYKNILPEDVDEAIDKLLEQLSRGKP